MSIRTFDQISNFVFCDSFLNDFDIETKLLPNPYYDYPYMIIKNFFNEELCEEITNSIRENSDFIDAKVKIENYTNQVDEDIRKTKIYKLNKDYKKLYEKVFKHHQSEIENYFNIALTTSSKLQVLEYKKGSFYVAHSDDSSMILKDEKLAGFKCVANNRKLTTVLFTTSCEDSKKTNSFTGGELIFNYLYDENGENIILKPSAGDMVIFLSNPYFTHEVLEVKSGYRLSLVQWHDAIIN
ncbi:MAG: 2OG-Fe(II) oxygenase [Halarcobacter sp.]